MKRQLAFVLSGGGARGALQVGALKALLEAGIRPDMLVGTSIGGVNAAFLALRGITLQSVEELVAAWDDAARADLLPANYLWLTVRSLLGRPSTSQAHRLSDFFAAHGVAPELHFGDIRGVRLVLVATDMNAGGTALFGLDPTDSVLEGLLASTALPPWVMPMERKDQLLIDGGMLSNLPIEPALLAGATEIIALDLKDPREAQALPQGIAPFLARLIYSVEQRQQHLELALASARHVPVTHIRLLGDAYVPVWDFASTDELICRGYQVTQEQLAKRPPASWLERLRGWWRRAG